MSQAGQKIIDGLKDAIAGNFSRVTIEGQTWTRRDATEWQPIETAPKDATGVWLIVDGQPCLGYWDPNDAPWAAPKWFVKAAFRRRGRAGKIVTDEIFGIYAHAHWMPLPDPPAPHPGASDTHRMPV